MSEKNPDPYTTLFGGGVVWLDDGVKASVIGFGEDIYGDRVVVLAIEGHPDPETGELGITEVLTAYHDWSVWRDYRLVRDAEGMVELLVDDDPAPVVSFPYASLNMESLGGPFIMFGNLIEGQNARVLFEFDQFDYSVGMPNTGGCTSADGKMRILSLLNMNRAFDPRFESNQIAAKVDVRSIQGLGGSGQGHTFFLRFERIILDANGHVIRIVRDEVQIGTADFGKRSPYLLLQGVSLWDGETATGDFAPDGTYSYVLNVSIVRKDKKLGEKVLNTVSAAGFINVFSDATPSPYVKDILVTRFGEFYDTVAPRTPVSYRLRGCSTGSDPILDVLYNPWPGVGYQNFATNDDRNICGCGGDWASDSSHTCSCNVGAMVTITPALSGGTGGNVRGIVRAKRTTAAGTCRLERLVGQGDWQYMAPGRVRFGGYRADWGWHQGDEIQTLLKDPGEDTMLVLAEATTFNMFYNGAGPAYDENGGVGAASMIRANASRAKGFVFAGQKAWAVEGKIDLGKNDRWNDADGDGLGASLEAALGTCDDAAAVTQAGYDCSRAFNTQDTDGDGLSDYVETFGCDRVCEHADYTENGCFNHFGVCPGGTLQKVDYAQLLPQWGANPLRKDVFIEIDRVNNRWGAVTPGPTTIATLHEKFNESSWANANPDGSAALNLHFDVDFDPYYYCGVPGLCGDFGGVTQFPENDYHPIECWVWCVYRAGGRRPCGDTPLCKYNVDWFPPIRRGLFLFGLVQPADHGWEGGVNYGEGFAVNSGQDAEVLVHEIGHAFGLEHYGGAQAGAHNCKPHYTSVMNYFYEQDFGGDPTAVHFSDGRYQAVLNPVSLCESDGLGGVDVGFLARSHTFFTVQDGGVDWNRDGVINDCSDPVQACVHCPPTGTAWGSALQHRFSPFEFGATSDSTPAAASFGGDLFVFYKQPTGYAYKEFDGFEGCRDGAACDKWSPAAHLTMQHSPSSAPSLADFVPAGGQEGLFLLYRSADNVGGNNLWLKAMSADGQWADEEIPVGVLANPTYDPALVNYRGDLLVMFHDSGGGLWQKQMSPEGVWDEAIPAANGSGQQMVSCNSPALAVKPLVKITSFVPFKAIDLSIVHLVAAGCTGEGCEPFDTYYYDDTTSRWQEGVRFTPDETHTDVRSNTHCVSGTGKVGFAWQPGGGLVTGGRFYLLYRGETNQPQYDFMINEQQSWYWGMNDSVFGPEGYLAGTGADIRFHVGNGLFGIVGVYALATRDPWIVFVPYASGIYDYELRDWNDWDTMSKGICASIVKPALGDGVSFGYCGPGLGPIIVPPP
ncbi:MAG: hypothetical protein HY897_08965 [Deltaproteobacteria bacterium]|nr:hypothetical protein [Deltaproteobacteria bacterium]